MDRTKCSKRLPVRPPAASCEPHPHHTWDGRDHQTRSTRRRNSLAWVKKSPPPPPHLPRKMGYCSCCLLALVDLPAPRQCRCARRSPTLQFRLIDGPGRRRTSRLTTHGLRHLEIIKRTAKTQVSQSRSSGKPEPKSLGRIHQK